MKDNMKESQDVIDFKEVLTELELIEAPDKKIEFLINEITEWEQHNPLLNNFPFLGMKPNFGAKCELEIKKIKRIKNENQNNGKDSLTNEPYFKLSDRTGSKIDLIRVLNAIYGLNLIVKPDGLRPTKKEFMAVCGNYFGVDLSRYAADLSQALKNFPLETNIKVFQDMIEVTQKQHFEK